MIACGTPKPCQNYLLKSFIIFTLMISLSGCGGGDGAAEGSFIAEENALPVGAAVSLAWEPVQDPSVYAYFVRYGPETSGGSGSCSYPYSTYVGSPSATITGLNYDTHYFFAVSAFNGSESGCSNEVSTSTTSAG